MFVALLLCLLAAAHAEPAPDDTPAWRAYATQLTPAAHPEPAYHFLAEVHHRLLLLHAAAPGRIVAEHIGDTVEGRPIWAFRVSAPSSSPRKKMLVFAQIHALEWITTEVAMALLAEAVAQPPDDVELVVIPVLNVDGRMKVERDLRAGADRFRRGNAPNIDLNRDFAENREATSVWRHLLPRRHASSPASLSQPESQALAAFSARERFDVAISLHAWGGYLYYPWAGRWERPDNWREMEALGRVMQEGQPDRAYQVHQLGRWAFFFRGHGMEIDHLYGQDGSKAFLIELTRSGRQLFVPRTWRPKFRIYNPEDPRDAVERGVGALRALARHLGG